MENQPLYLRHNIQVDPLINQWYAWFHLLPPATAALNIIERHLNTMRSYIASPTMHAMAILNPAMRGGPFIDLGGKRVDEVKALLAETEENTKELAAFVAAIRELNTLLKEEAQGALLQPLYAKVPGILRGYVELVYDLNNNPSFRLFEPLLYHSPFFRKDMQSVALTLAENDENRPFIFTTPRLPDAQSLMLNLPFGDLAWDLFFAAKRTATPYRKLKEAMGITPEQEPLFRTLFTEEAPAAYAPYTGENIRMRYFGHACILLETHEVSILIDPVLSYSYETDISRYTYEDLPDWIDYVLITHGHHDHIMVETMLQLRHKVGQVVIGYNMPGLLQDPSLKLALEHIGFAQVRQIAEYETLPIPGGGRIMGIPFLGEHHDLMINSKLCYFIEMGGMKVLSVADSCNIEPELYAHVHRMTGDADVLFLGMECDGAPLSWVYGPLMPEPLARKFDHSRRGRGCNFEEGMALVNQFSPAEVYVYAMGEEPWVRHILDVAYAEDAHPIVQSNQLIAECKEAGRMAERLFAEKEIIGRQVLTT